MFEHARVHRDFYRALVGSPGGTVALGSIRQILCDLMRKELAATVDKNSVDVIPRELVVQYVVGAYMAVLTWWLDGGGEAAVKADRCDVSPLGDRGQHHAAHS